MNGGRGGQFRGDGTVFAGIGPTNTLQGMVFSLRCVLIDVFRFILLLP